MILWSADQYSTFDQSDLRYIPIVWINFHLSYWTLITDKMDLICKLNHYLLFNHLECSYAVTLFGIMQLFQVLNEEKFQDPS